MTITQTSFLNPQKIRDQLHRAPPSRKTFDEILARSRLLKGLKLEDVAQLLLVSDKELRDQVLKTAGWVKEQIYGKRLVLFAPLYLGNECSNNCLYCAFRKGNTGITRRTLNQAEIALEAQQLLREGHKRLMVLNGESEETPLDYILESLKTIYSQRIGTAGIRRINLEIAPLDVAGFQSLSTAGIGTYVCFQETYDPELYSFVHPEGPKSDYVWRLEAMDRAMKGGLKDVGVGALFGLGDWKFEILGIFEHARHLEERFGCGPHTVSVPRLEPADGSEMSSNVPHPVSDDDFRYLVSLIRIALPYVGIILSTREKPELRHELFHYGVSQISAGSRTNPGAYAGGNKEAAQFSLGDHRTLAEVLEDLVDSGFVPSFCTGCYRMGRIGADFMDLAKPGLIQHYCLPNGLLSFQEYLEDFAKGDLKTKGDALVRSYAESISNEALKKRTLAGLAKVRQGGRDVYY